MDEWNFINYTICFKIINIIFYKSIYFDKFVSLYINSSKIYNRDNIINNKIPDA